MIFSQHHRDNPLKEKLAAGKPVIGTWINTLRDPLVVKLAAAAGFDYLFIDQEHSGISDSELATLCLVARECGIPPIVRQVECATPSRNGRTLDSGAVGLVVPHVESREQLEEVIASTRYTSGLRGYVSRSLNTGFAKNDAEMLRRTEENTVIVAQFEDTAAIADADSILSAKGVDITVVGRGDLAVSMGLAGQTNDPRVTAEVEKVIAAANRNGVAPGLLVQTVEEAKLWLDKGVRCITFGSEAGILLSAYEKAVGALKL